MTTFSRATPDFKALQISVACHVHSDWSYDGNWTLSNIADAFHRRRYRVVMMAEHAKGFNEAKWLDYQAACAQASSMEILLLPGIEYSDGTNTVHILVWGCKPFLGDELSTSVLLSKAKQHDGVSILAHPSRRSMWRIYDSSWSHSLMGIEIWNRKTDGWAPSPHAHTLVKQTGLAAFAGLDFHDRRQFFPLCMNLTVTNSITETGVLAALRSRRFRLRCFGQSLDRVLIPGIHRALLTAEWARRRIARTIRLIRHLGPSANSNQISTRLRSDRAPVDTEIRRV
jgi:hypothetical protein